MKTSKNYYITSQNMPALVEKKQKFLSFKGPIAAPLTPFDKNGELNTSKIFEYAQFLVKQGIKGVYISGTTGEGYSLSLTEKIQLIEAWHDALKRLPENQKLLSIIHGSSTCVPEIVKLAKRVEELNFDCFALLPPIYYRSPNKEHLTEYFRQIMEKGAPNTTFLYYHSFMTGEPGFEFEPFVELALEKIPQFVAIKFSQNNIVQYATLQSKFGDRIQVCPGLNDILFPARVYNGWAPICSSFSLPACISGYYKILDAVERQDYETAGVEQQKITDLCAALRKSGYLASIKKQLDVEVGEGVRFGMPRSPVYIEY